MSKDEILLSPFNYVILECPFDYLVEYVRGHQLIYISVGEVLSERLISKFES